MRILAIRGQHLASLNKFEVSLSHGPLANAGLFAITGPTGAGKSTLLDAMCLALYARLPRIKREKGGYEVSTGATGDEALPFTDCRHIIQRGQRTAYAEVDFLGCDNKRWRARWEVKTSQRSSKLPASTTELFELENTNSSSLEISCRKTKHKKTETLELIRQKVGLSYEQFCRSVLLAQGDFAAFLKASSEERADLLEVMTDTQLYTELSKAAHERAKQEKKVLDDLQGQLRALNPLSDDERRQLETQRKQCEERCRELAQQSGIYAQAQQWYARQDALEAELQRAEEAHDNARQAQQEAEAQRTYLNRLDQAHRLRPLYERHAAATRELHQAVQKVTETKSRHEHALAALNENRSQAQQAEKKLADIKDEQTKRQPDIAQARDLDAQLKAAQQAASEAKTKLDAAKRELAERKQRLADVKQEYAKVTEAIAQNSRWLKANGHLELLANQQERWERDLAAYLNISTALAEQKDREAKLKADLERSLAELEQAQAALRDAEGQLERDKQEREAAVRQLERLTATRSPDARRAARRQLDEKQATLRALKGLAEAAEKAERDRAAAAQEVQAAQMALDEQQQAYEQRQQERAMLKDKLQGHQQDLLLAQATEELAARRPDLLVPGKPCPLCGSTEHPDADKPAPAGALVAHLRGEVEAAQQRLNDCTQSLQALHAQVAAQATQMESAHRRQDEAAQAQAQLLADWERQRWPDLPTSPLDPATRSTLDAVSANLDAERDRLEAEEADYEKARRERDAAQQAVDQSHERYGQAQAAYQRAANIRQQRDSDLKQCHTQREAQEQQLHRLAADLATVFAGHADWQAQLAADANAFLAQALSQSADWRATSQAQQEALDKQQDIECQLAVCQSDVDRAQTTLEQAERDAAARADTCRQLETKRKTLLGGQPTEDFCRMLDAAVAAAEQVFRDAHQKLNVAEREKTRAQTDYETAQAQWREKSAAAQAAHDELQARLAETGLSETELDALLAVPQTVQQELRQHLAELDEKVTQTAAVRQDKRQALAEHRQSAVPTISREDLPAKIQTLEDDYQCTLQTIGQLTEKLRQDDATRQAKQALEAQFAAQETVHRRWAELDAVIGASDGKKFRLFVQNLQFQTLLDHANAYLRRLRQRYHLLPVPDPEASLELQVRDRDMGDTIRPISTLSGGETFLVSLALALGLAAMNANKVTLQSLFIDEGFGTLDPQSLETALGMLDELQATGCQIGIISHIPELAERIGYRIVVMRTGQGTSQVAVCS